MWTLRTDQCNFDESRQLLMSETNSGFQKDFQQVQPELQTESSPQKRTSNELKKEGKIIFRCHTTIKPAVGRK